MYTKARINAIPPCTGIVIRKEIYEQTSANGLFALRKECVMRERDHLFVIAKDAVLKQSHVGGLLTMRLLVV